MYDTPGFFSAYSQLPRSVHGLDGAPEWPTLQAMLPGLAGKRVLDLGCGFGWFCRWAAGQGAAEVLGVDVSENMLARARAETTRATVHYKRADLERFAPPQPAFDLAYSSLAFHYLTDLAGLLARVSAGLLPGGQLVCSVEHPLMTSPRHQGWTQDESGVPTWPVNGYLDEGPRVTDWLAKGVVKQHRSIATYLELLRRAGLVLTDLREWGPSVEQVAANPEWSNERQRPAFLLLAARKS
ncbi:SAM-dependent methyltransferase [Bosea sp. Root381]|nr:SAM-dependent methyltransferase [Bosea sp. Root381]